MRHFTAPAHRRTCSVRLYVHRETLGSPSERSGARPRRRAACSKHTGRAVVTASILLTLASKLGPEMGDSRAKYAVRRSGRCLDYRPCPARGWCSSSIDNNGRAMKVGAALLTYPTGLARRQLATSRSVSLVAPARVASFRPTQSPTGQAYRLTGALQRPKGLLRRGIDLRSSLDRENYVPSFVAQSREKELMTETIYDALRESHETQRTLFRKVLRSKPGTRDRISLFTELRLELTAHEAAEERFLYVPILMDDMGLSSSRHALHEHHQIDELIEDAQSLDPASEEWLLKLKELSHKVHHHLREEERKFFQVSGKILSDKDKTRLAGRYRRDHARMLEVLRPS